MAAMDRPGLERRPIRHTTSWCGPAQLAVRLEERLRPRAPTTLPVADGFVLDIDARVLLGDRGIVHLRPREFQLLAALAACPGRALSRPELIDLVWGGDRRVGLRNVDIHVHWLRSKIEPVPTRPTHLIAVRGFGYRLDPAPR